MAASHRPRFVSSVSRAYSHDPFERVDSISGSNSDHSLWKLSQGAAISLIEKGSDAFFFRVGTETVKLVVLTRRGEKYLQSEREATHPDDLLSISV
ncbi:MAG: DUF3892 domain-containing protein [Opitutus sp.]